MVIEGEYINGHVWRDVRDITTASQQVLSLLQVEKIDGDPARRHEINYDESSGGS